MDLTKLEEMKESFCPCVAFLVAEVGCITPCPSCVVNGKVCCCTGGVQCAQPCIQCEGAPCFSRDHGCVEVAVKLCCTYAEIQLPPARDIGCALCGKRCCGGASGRETETYISMDEAPKQEAM
mmetsp:Transcript_54413/g.145200  ORF Transcript_54413/g.145200 Transcript_54413/m.145200 type:complete len:123 (-) Transcript_54413:142-510(-)|eukprot:CAMPEP_0194476966 /NCGR_PEP_ID=MMETSP0253-20130528/762_1 /TAXON_ID=2966 /ORGANISM="Noctiluca scintillans" /LENGTH=122 /DNA_ID=CAMNT_0039315875 /DNA_START=77 /DNA_END=445 /DNA_ORIENTATION=+